MLSANQLRQQYLDFFKKQQHLIIPSASLVPENDPTTLFTTAGMQAMMPYLLGAPYPHSKRVADSQKCFRAQDIEEVGDNRHTTFFEMLGNWSLGDYFKKEQLGWFFQFLTETVGLPAEKLYVTVFAGDEKYGIEADQEAAQIWQSLFAQKGIQAEIMENPTQIGADHPQARIFFYPAEKNWWSRCGVPDNMTEGEPGGPDSEVFYDFGPEFKFHENSQYADQPCHVNCDCGRYLEIGNSVFMQYQKIKAGFKTLPQRNIDFGGGLERILAASHNQPDIFQTDLFLPLIEQIKTISSQSYSQDNQVHFRVIADHIKAAVMLMADGVLPSNKDRGYVVRRLLRRALRHAKYLTNQPELLTQLIPGVMKIYEEAYPSLLSQQEKIATLVTAETNKFEKTLAKALQQFDKLLAAKQVLNGELAFSIYQSCGFPLEMMVEEAQTRNIKLDPNLEQEFDQKKQLHAQVSKVGADEKFKK